MGERNLIIDQLKFGYEGLFNAAELYAVISQWFFDKGWDYSEKINQEQVTPAGKQTRIIFTPWKNVSDYYKISMRIKFHIADAKDVDVEKDGRVIRLQQGQIRMLIDAYVTSDRKGMWSGSPFKWLFQVLANKIFFSEHFGKAQQWIESDVEDLYDRIRTYLNSYKYQYRNE